MATYLDDRQRAELAHAARHWVWRTELPTWLLIAVVYSAWFGVATHARQLGLPLACVLLTLCTTWYLSLQHELLHGHPTRLPWLNALLGAAPLGIWLPYGLYRRLHLQHHEAELTHPDTDPESYFLYAVDWHAASPATRKLYAVRNTLAGRMLLQPAFSILAVAADAFATLRAGDGRDRCMWIAHGLAVVALLTWLQTSCGMPAWLVLVGVAYPALSLAAIRSFQEHRAGGAHATSSVINEAGLAWRLLFLNNNYHLVHHDLPCVPWFALAWVYRRRAGDYLARNGGFHVRGYWEWLSRYALRAAAPVAHPLFHGPTDRYTYAAHPDGDYGKA
ncbi:fatty acid desaturase [Ralstonia insidiosa]|uniref:Fatty acid desaturase n=2 Tax=Burkholderiaceae TaxID=119060 RepID=A0A192A3H2_9RALS|nr:fatty acid desaturase [Ralstonia insidiosa]ANJ74893.1 fatty acid desaturase [Ralstonia insidiosa]KAB0468386.1 fatty acid desaturase [Ralstonia insidiosa]MBY4911096.1 fatty acid desaturase [Ralstonia insidiosa]NMV37852.1 fatty acid desaturase [Ralstonia insidiosa]